MTDAPPDHGAWLPDWERRFRAPRVGLPDWADDAPDRAVVIATSGGVVEVHSWSRVTGELIQATSRPEGTSQATIDPAGEWIWWFDDADGDEFGVWRRQPFGSGPETEAERADGDLPAAYPAGLALGRQGLAVIGRADDSYGTQIHVLTGSAEPRLLYAHAEDAGIGALSEDGTLLAIGHSEHGDSRHPALRVIRIADGGTVAELWDGPELGVEAEAFAPIKGDTRLLVQHERRGRGELLIWDIATGEQREIELAVNGEPVDGEVSAADWFIDGSALLVAIDRQARTRLYRVELDGCGLTPIGADSGSAQAATVRPDGDVWTLWSSAAEPAAIRDLGGAVVLAAPGEPAPGSVPVEDVWVEGPGGQVHALLRRPAGPDGAPLAGPLPTIVDMHGGPTHHDTDAFRAYPSAWVDHGYAVVEVNYRGSTGYGSAWRDALQARVGHVELEDVVAVRDHLVAAGVVDPDRIVLAGASWGGYLTLLGLGTYPDRWTVGLAGVPVADYLAAYQDEMEGLKAFDRSLFGGSPDEVPATYRDSSPLTYVDGVRVPVLILAGENDPRCPIRQIENYVAALKQRGVPHEVYRYEAGHGSLVDDERVRQARLELDFAARHLHPAGRVPSSPAGRVASTPR
ncbi:MAG TPA: prolyl oligopeptidase family serine peptidase [Kineosporiaceae bacterium]|nr:prolyl oligopeptidase family serine peptidase [Kineosporiaceae bacterium]